MSGARKRGFTLVESLVGMVIVAIGVVGVMGGYSRVLQTEVKLRDTQRMHGLAQQKLDELMATGQVSSGAQSGDFSDQNMPEYHWSMSVDSTGVTDLTGVSVSVTHGTGDDAPKETVTSLLYVPPTSTAGGAQ